MGDRDKRCENCAAFRVYASRLGGECLRHPPTPVVHGDDMPSLFPTVNHYDFCLDWCRKETDQ